MATKTSKLPQATKKNDEVKLMTTVGNKQTKMRESLPNARKTSISVHDDAIVKRRHLSVVDDNEQVRRGSVDAEKTDNVRKTSYKSDKNENKQSIRQVNQRHKSMNHKIDSKGENGSRVSSVSLTKYKNMIEKPKAADGKTRKTDDYLEIPKDNIPPVEVIPKEIETVLEVVSPETLPLPEGIINIDLDDGMFEYGAEIVAYLKERETLFVLPEDFLLQNSVSELMRSILVDWLIQVSCI